MFSNMDKIEIRYTMLYAKRGAGLALGDGLPRSLREAKPEYERLCEAIEAFIKRVDSMPGRSVEVTGGLELNIR